MRHHSSNKTQDGRGFPASSQRLIQRARKTGQRMSEGNLLVRLSGTEKAGIIRGTIDSVQEEPTYVWKTNIAKKKSGEPKRLSVWKQIITRGLK